VYFKLPVIFPRFLGHSAKLTEADTVLIPSIYPEEECEVRTLKDGASGYLTKEREHVDI